MINLITHRLSALSTYCRARKLIEPFNPHWFAGKRVAIIGGADSVLDEKKGAYIDAFDVVVRVNNGARCIETQHEYVGTRTDFLVHSFFNPKDDGKTSRFQIKGSSPFEIDLWKKHNVKKIISARNLFLDGYALSNIKNFLRETSYSCPFVLPGKALLGKTNGLLSTSPTTGFSALSFVYHSNPKEMFVTGFTFMRSPANRVYRCFNEEDVFEVIQNAHHDFDEEMSAFRFMCTNSKIRILVDRKLTQFLAT